MDTSTLLMYTLLVSPKKGVKIFLARLVTRLSHMLLRLGRSMAEQSNKIVGVPPIVQDSLPPWYCSWLVVKQNGARLDFDGVIAPNRQSALLLTVQLPGELKMLENLDTIRRQILKNAAGRSMGTHVQ